MKTFCSREDNWIEKVRPSDTDIPPRALVCFTPPTVSTHYTSFPRREQSLRGRLIKTRQLQDDWERCSPVLSVYSLWHIQTIRLRPVWKGNPETVCRVLLLLLLLLLVFGVDNLLEQVSFLVRLVPNRPVWSVGLLRTNLCYDEATGIEALLDCYL